jgi:hypothetical protein
VREYENRSIGDMTLPLYPSSKAFLRCLASKTSEPERILTPARRAIEQLHPDFHFRIPTQTRIDIGRFAIANVSIPTAPQRTSD